MKTPTWATVIAVIMIVFGGCGAINDIRSISMPEKLEEGKEKIKIKADKKALQDSTAIAALDSTETAGADSIAATSDGDADKADIPFFGKKSQEEILTLSEFSKTWIVRFGYIGAVVSLIYLVGGIFLLVRRVFSIKIVYAALAISILCAGAQTSILTSTAAGDFMSKMVGLSQLPSILIDIVLLAVVFASDKDAYKEENLSR
jgi:Na+-translocating ferredoxin:NAD+ oxidoreductase RnfD subunit